ncbi:hypothetical protein CTheo_8995 [Ceratobasidium theobromae]|uniref:Uncharacterized protein n=1 Tax=Ceratobasidium theobromae TaxID=1582974 RepID=A0A5N5Q827_9AGAM|nr:hypothetical protein CTheo_8995 [Ceratobasidium theobromae]
MARGSSRKKNSKRAVSAKKQTANQHRDVIEDPVRMEEGPSRAVDDRMEEMDSGKGEKRGPSDSFDRGNPTHVTRSKRARLEDDREGNVDNNDGDDQEDAGGLEVAEQRDLAELWEESVQTLRKDNVVPSSDVVELQSKLNEARLGGGLLRFCGVGDAHGVVDLSDDPNARGNPRPINMAHVDALYEIFQRPGAKRDHEAPAILVTSPSLVDAECLQEMKDKDPRDVAAILPCIRVVRQEATQEDELENRLWLCRIDGTSMTKEVILRDTCKLKAMRKSRKRMKLLNGNHRFQAMLRLADDLYRRRDEINRLLDLPQEKKDPDLIRKMVEDLKQDVLGLTWRVEVYNGKQTSTIPTR